MVHIDNSRKIASKQMYDELIKTITSLDGDDKLHRFYLASEHISDMEQELLALRKSVGEYESFFKTLNMFLPKQESDKYGITSKY